MPPPLLKQEPTSDLTGALYLWGRVNFNWLFSLNQAFGELTSCISARGRTKAKGFQTPFPGRLMIIYLIYLIDLGSDIIVINF